ncbi:MAG TPA: 30S ribosomal protein S13 [Methanofastidiosum sp.]|jgi:small subunit ribosomal protein S13|nr:30S ribosomal protein S13 [Methanofastidiosum sp.]HOI77369.1 30S ribosomal protein S13 [Methanofastidiosum sp.]
MDEEVKGIVRVLGTNIMGNDIFEVGVLKIRGVGPVMARAVAQVAGISPKTKVGNIPPEKIKIIETIIENPINNGIPVWLVNRRKDYETGENVHVVGPKLLMSLREDLNRMKKMKSYKGVRHQLGLPVRGQRTKSSFRKGTSLGVQRKKATR